MGEEKVIVLGGFSRFPIFFTSDGKKSVGSQSEYDDLNYYVSLLKGKFVILHSLQNLQFRSRFVVEGKAINPELKTAEVLPKHIYIYPDQKPEDILMNALTLGFILKGGRKTVYVPLLSRRALSKKEVNAILGIIEIGVFGIDRFKVFMEKIGARLEILRELPNNRIVIRINDPEVNGIYRVLINNKGNVFDADFCVHTYQHLFLPELVMFCREYGSVHHIGGFDY